MPKVFDVHLRVRGPESVTPKDVRETLNVLPDLQPMDDGLRIGRPKVREITRDPSAVFRYRVPIAEAMNWELYKESLTWRLDDTAIEAARVKGFREGDRVLLSGAIQLDGDHFVVEVHGEEN